jgi:hypothetical protein
MAAILGIIVAVVLLVIFVPSKSNKDKSTITKANLSLSAAQEASAIKEIKANFITFFAKDTPLGKRELLLQSGSKFAQPMQSEFKQLGTQNPSITINSVNFKTNSSADIYYTIYLDGQPVLKNQIGGALLIGKIWKVSDSTLCQLFSLGGKSPSVCNNVH